MSRCELALEEDALITSEQLEPQGTLWTLKKHKPWIRTQGENLQKNGSEDLCQIKKMHKKEWEYNHFPFTQ
jgi:hypothetical protein